jgi:predicted DNA binding CopG/RHH family protein
VPRSSKQQKQQKQQKRDSVLFVRVSPSEHAQVRRAAAKHGLSGSTFIRMILLEYLAREAKKA